jgi:hypothetical protein
MVGTGTAGAADVKLVFPGLEFPSPLPVVVAAAARNGLALAGIDPAVEGAGALKPGDQVTALVSWRKGEELKQWVVEMTGVDLNAPEQQRPPFRTSTFYTNTGTQIELRGTRAVLAVRVLGPFDSRNLERDPGQSAVEQRSRVMVNADYLSLGLDRACASVMAVNAARQKDPGLPVMNWSLREQPFSAEVTAAGRKLSLPLGLTPERERALAGAVPALLEFFHLIRQTPGLQDILRSVMDVPWWTVVKSAGEAPIGLMPQFRLAQHLPVTVPLPAAQKGPAYAVPFLLTIGGQPALVGVLAVVNPQRPLLVCAGIVGVAAGAPDGRGPRILLQIVATHLGGDRVASPPSR